jgi:hypothetical protein
VNAIQIAVDINSVGPVIIPSSGTRHQVDPNGKIGREWQDAAE